MFRKLIVHGSVAALMLPASGAWPQLPRDGAPLAQSGRYDVVSEPAVGSPRHIVFRPANLSAFPEQDTLPVMVWANGGCSTDSSPYAAFLTTIASHGFLVLAIAHIEGADLFSIGESGPTTYDEFTSPFRAALDWAEAEAARESSALKGKVAIQRPVAPPTSAC